MVRCEWFSGWFYAAFFKKTLTKLRESKKLVVLFLEMIKNDYLCVTINLPAYLIVGLSCTQRIG